MIVTIERPNITEEERKKVLERGAYIAALMLQGIKRRMEEENNELRNETSTTNSNA